MLDELEKPVGKNFGLLFHHIVSTVFDNTTGYIRGHSSMDIVSCLGRCRIPESWRVHGNDAVILRQ